MNSALRRLARALLAREQGEAGGATGAPQAPGGAGPEGLGPLGPSGGKPAGPFQYQGMDLPLAKGGTRALEVRGDIEARRRREAAGLPPSVRPR